MSDDNAFTDALDAQEHDHDDDASDPADVDLDAFREQMDIDGNRTKTIGIGVTPEMRAFYKRLRADESIDIDPVEMFRENMMNLSHRHPDVLEDAKKIYEIENK